MPTLVAERFAQRLAERERAILDRVVLVDLQVACAGQFEREAAVARDLLEHVVVEADAGRDRDRRRAIEVHPHVDVGFLGLARARSPCDRDGAGARRWLARSRRRRRPRRTRKPCEAQVRGQLQVGLAVADHVAVAAGRSGARAGMRQQTRSSACGTRSRPAVDAGQKNSASNSMPCEAKQRADEILRLCETSAAGRTRCRVRPGC